MVNVELVEVVKFILPRTLRHVWPAGLTPYSGGQTRMRIGALVPLLADSERAQWEGL